MHYRSRSEEAISEHQEEDGVYKGLRVLDHPTSMYNIHKCFHDEDNPVIYDSPKKPTAVADQTSQLPTRSQSADGRESETFQNGIYHDKTDGSNNREDTQSNNTTEKHPFDESTGSDTESGRNTVRGPFTNGSDGSRCLSYTLNGSHHDATPFMTSSRFSLDMRKKISDTQRPIPYIGGSEELLTPPRPSSVQPDLNQAVDNLRVSYSDDSSGTKPKINDHVDNKQSEDTKNKTESSINQTQEWTSYSRYDYRNTNPYMYDLRSKPNGVKTPYIAQSHLTKQPQDTSDLDCSYQQTEICNGNTVYDASVPCDGSAYLDMDR